MPTYEPSISQQIGSENIANFGKMIGDMIHPNLEFQKSMTLAVSKDPKLAQSLADLEHNAPGSLQSMGFGSVGAVLSRLPESPDNQALRERRPEAVQAAKNRIAAEDASTGVTIERINNLLHVLKTNPTVSADDALHTLTGQTSAQRTISTAEAGVAPIKAKAEGAKAGEEIASSKYLQKKYEDMFNGTPNAASSGDYMQMAHDFVNGKTSPALQALMATPTIPGTVSPKDLFDRALQVVQAKQREGFEIYIAGIRSSDIKKREATQHAYDSYKNSGYVGSMGAWQQFLADPSAAKGSSDPDLQAVANAASQVRQDKVFSQIRSLNSQLKMSVDGFATAIKPGSPAPESVITAKMATIQNLLNQRSLLTKHQYTANYGYPPGAPETSWGGMVHLNKSLYFTNASGDVVEASQALGDLGVISGDTTTTTPVDTIGKPKLTGNALRAYTDISALKTPELRKQALDKLKSISDSVYNMVKPLIK